MNLHYKSYVYSSYSDPSTIDALSITKPVNPEELKNRYPNLAGLHIEFSVGDFQPLKINHDEYLDQVVKTLDLKELKISQGRCKNLPASFWTSGIQHLTIRTQEFELVPPAGWTNPLRSIELAFKGEIDPEILRGNLLEEVKISDFTTSITAIQNAKSLRKLILHNGNFEDTFSVEACPHLHHLVLSSLQGLTKLTGIESLQKITHLSLLKLVDLKPLQLNLSRNTTLKELTIDLKDQDVTLDLRNLSELYQLHIREVKNCAIQSSGFKMLSNLSLIRIQELAISDEFWNTPNVYEVHLNHVPIKDFPSVVYPNLKQLWLNNVPITELENALPALRLLSIEDCKITTWPGWIEKNKSLERLTCLKVQTETLPSFGKENSTLQEISFAHTNVEAVPSSWTTCPQLSMVTLHHVVNKIPADVFNTPTLKVFVYCADGIAPVLPSNWALRRSLLRVDIAGLTTGQNQWLRQMLDQIEKENWSDVSRTVLSTIIFEGEEVLKNLPAWQNQLVEALEAPTPALRSVVQEKARLLRPADSTLSVDLFKNKTVYLSPGSKRGNNYYKNKFKELGAEVKSKLSLEVDCIMMNERFEIPEGYWAQDRIVFSEEELDALFATEAPQFLQTADTDELENLRNLLWSNDPANDLLVATMLEAGGIAPALVPDVMVVAKMSKNEAAKTKLRKVLKSALSKEEQLILSNPKNLNLKFPFEDFERIAADFDTSQMAVSIYKRTGLYLPYFFLCRNAEQNPYRRFMFEQIFPACKLKPHYLAYRSLRFTQEELRELLLDPFHKGNIKRLQLNVCNLEGLKDILLNEKNLNELIFDTNETFIPEWIVELKKLSTLHIHAPRLLEVPEFLKNIKIKEFRLRAPLAK